MNLRATLTLSLVTLGLVGIVASLALMLLTRSLEQVSVRLDDSVEAVYLAQRAVEGMLVHRHASSPASRIELENQLLWDFRTAASVVTTTEGRAVLAVADDAVGAYLDPVEREGEYERALSSLHAFVNLNLQQAGEARAHAARLYRVGRTLGGVGAIALPALVVLTMVWLARSFRPVLELGRAMDRYGRGERGARAPVAGPTEIREMTLHFNQMAEALGRQREVHLAFLAGVAHDLRNPLAAIRMATYFLQSDRACPTGATVHDVRESLARQVDHLDRMLGDLIESVRIDAGHLSLVEGEHDVRVLARDVVDMFSRLNPDHRIELHAPPDPVVSRCDATRIGQVLTNLVSNAVKYSPPRTTVDVTVERAGADVTITVRDEGVGIPEDELAVVFEPFHRGRAEGPEVPGAGLGLYVSRRIVQAHGGRIEVQSAPGRGSTFVVHLPAARATQTAA